MTANSEDWKADCLAMQASANGWREKFMDLERQVKQDLKQSPEYNKLQQECNTLREQRAFLYQMRDLQAEQAELHLRMIALLETKPQ